jgi:hypothetical protein
MNLTLNHVGETNVIFTLVGVEVQTFGLFIIWRIAIDEGLLGQ